MSPLSCGDYASKLANILQQYDWTVVEKLASELVTLARNNHTLYFCGNGGSAGNAIHLANDFLYGICPSAKISLKVESLSANPAVLTCLGNDIGYDQIYSHQLKTKGEPGDMLIVLSGSGNSPNIINVVKEAKKQGVKSVGVLGYQGGKALALVDTSIHFAIDDMQISEDLQLVVGHMLMRLVNTALREHYE
ncbi:SIS domain-containing protein [Aestuariibacter sp. A3R04]|uniref:SIS domain-containing protein n=1 Tax=Aestuariibacter sp. A3R04 TaxID=2841571 RepID=UPI001C08A2A9|nr:SIS domain-containing protein [Aestuariibacter sp. A3R04]MBU3022189.1 SIS domain-containing protein [Aestuariibacter sp. A3R04]